MTTNQNRKGRLVIHLETGGSVAIGDAMVTVTEIKGSTRVVLAIEAPLNMPIVRTEAKKREPRFRV